MRLDFWARWPDIGVMTWYAVYSQPGRTLLARDALTRAGLTAFCPVELLRRRRRVLGRTKYVVEQIAAPLFGRYLFAQGEVGELLAVRGVSDVVRAGLEALPVPESALQPLRDRAPWVDCVGHLVGQRDVSLLRLGFQGRVGDAFRFTGGSFAGLTGVIASLEGLERGAPVRVRLEMFGAEREVEVPRSMIGPPLQRAA